MINNAPIAKIQTPNATPTVTRNGQAVADAELFQWGDEISNTSATPMEIRIPARGAGQGDTLLVLQPGAAAGQAAAAGLSDAGGAADRRRRGALRRR